MFGMEQQDSGDLSHTDIHSHLYLGENWCFGSSECLAEGKVTNVRIFREINIEEIFLCSQLNFTLQIIETFCRISESISRETSSIE